MNRIYPVIALLCVSMFFSSSIYAQSCSDGNINRCVKEANQGNAASQYHLGFFYDTGEGVRQNKRKAVEWYRKAAEQGDARAQIDLGFAYGHGEGVKQDKQKAVEWYRKAAEQGNAIAQYNLGSVYDTGKGVKQNKQESVEWYRKAAEQGEVNAQYSLAYAYDTGEGVKQDHQKAAQWYEKAARQGDGEAQYTLGNIYKRGQGVSQNNIAAYMWLTLAAGNGIAQALKEHASVEKELTSAQLKNGQLLVRRWKGRQTIPSIPSFDVDIQMHADASLTVHERITYNFANTQRHGIYRDIPIMVKTKIGSWNIDLKVATVRMDGQAVPWTVKYNSSSNNPNVHVQIGDPDHSISGQHVYDIFYDVGYGILPLHGQDDMRWNVTGDQWKLMIEKASVTVHLPKQLSQDDIQARTYSGNAGSTSTEATFNWIDQQTFHADILPLTPGQQLTISLSFAEGLLLHSAKEIAEITKKEEPSWLRTYWHWCTFAFGVLWIFLYWFLRGRDPSPKTVTACYQPPEGIDAAHANLILEGNADASLDATILELVRDNYIAIKKNKSGRPTLTRLKTDDTLPAYKQTLMDALFHSWDTLNVDEQKNERECHYIRAKLDQMKDILSVWSVEKGYMRSSPEAAKSRFLALGLLLTGLLFFIALLDTALRYGNADDVIIGNFEFSGNLIVQSIMLLILLATLVHWATKYKRIFLISAAGLFFFLWFNGINLIDTLLSPFMIKLWLDAPILSQGMLMWLVILIAPYMPVKTALGTDIYAQLLGLKEFMSRVNKHDLEEMLQNDPGYMHALIPYAQVFGLLEHWVHQVKGLEQLTQDRANHTFEDSHLGELAGVSILTAGISGSLHNSGADSFSSGGGSDSGGGGGGGGGGRW